MAQPVPASSPASVVRDVTVFARALVAASRTRQMYSDGHPNAAAAAERLRHALAPLALHEGLTVGITPDVLLVNGEALPADPRVGEAAALLNDHDILQLRFISQPSLAELTNFLLLLTFDGDTLRRQGGPARVWENYGHYWLQIDQIDYAALLAPGVGHDTAGARADQPPSDRDGCQARDRVWRALVQALATGRAVFDFAGEKRLLEIVQHAEAIRALSEEAALSAEAGGQAQESAKAAAVLMTFQRLADTARAGAPELVDAAIANIAEAARKMDPALLMRVVGEAAESGLGLDLMKAVGERLNDDEVAALLATSLAAEGKASGRLAAALSSLAPGDERRGRVLRLARTRATAVVRSASDVSTAWHTLEKFLDGPADEAYVSRTYGHTLEQLEARSQGLRLDAPARLGEWTATVSAESVRTLSATLLIDLFALERHPAAIAETAQDLAALTEDLLLAGDTVEAARTVAALHQCTGTADVERAAASRHALDAVRHCAPLREIAAAAGDLDDRQQAAFETLCVDLGGPVADVLLAALEAKPAPETARRLESIVVRVGDAAVDALARQAAGQDPDMTRLAIRLLGRIGGPRAVTVLYGVARHGAGDRSRAAIHELVAAEHPAAGECLGHLLREGPLTARLATVDAVATARHPKAGPLLAGTLQNLDALGGDHDLAMRILTTLRGVDGRGTVPAIERVMHLTSWRRWRRAGRLKRLAVAVLLAMRTDEARQAIDNAARLGDRGLRRAIAAAGRNGN